MTLNKTLKETQSYYNKKSIGGIDMIVTKIVKKRDMIIYGARAVNKQLPSKLRRITVDYDIYSKSPKVAAKIIEKSLDKSFGFNAFKVEPARFEGTFKVISLISGEGVVDVTMKPKVKIGFVKRNGVKYANLDVQLKNIKTSLNDPASAWRHKKDIDTKNRILIARMIKKKKKKKKKNILGFSTKLNIKNSKIRGINTII